MKKVTKFLSILLLVAMCMSLFGGSAYALELGGNDSSSAPTAVNDGVQFGGDDAYLDGGSSGSTDLEISEEPTIGPILKAPVKPPVISGGEAEINGTQYETLEKALAAAKSGDTIKFINDITSNSPLTISTAVTIDLNDFTWNVNGGLTVNAAVTVTDSSTNGELYMNSAVNVSGCTLALNNLDLYVQNNLNVSYNGKVEMTNVYNNDFDLVNCTLTEAQLVIYSGGFKYNPEKYNANGTIVDKDTNGRFIVKVGSDKYQALLNGSYYETLDAAFKAAKNGDTVYVLKQTAENKVSGAVLDNSRSITLDLNNEEITEGNIEVKAGSTLTITNGWIDQSVANAGNLTINSNVKIGTVNVVGGYVYNNGEITNLNINDGSFYMSLSNASVGAITVASKPSLVISNGTVGSISENTSGAPKTVTGGSWSSENVKGYVADGYEAVEKTVGTWTIQLKGTTPNPTPAPTPTGKPVSATITIDNTKGYYQYNQRRSGNPALRFTANPKGDVTRVDAYTASGAQILSLNSDYTYDTNTGVITLSTSYVENIKAQTVTLYFYFRNETNPASATVHVVPSYSLSTNSYNRDSGNANDVYFTLSSGSPYGYKYGTSDRVENATALPSGSYSESQSGSYTYLRFTKSFLDSLANGNYYFFYMMGNSNVCVKLNTGNALRISGSGSPVNPPITGDYMLDYISGIDSWYSGDSMLGFRIQPTLGRNGGIAVDGYIVPGEDYVDKGTGLIYLGTSYLGNLKTGWHWLTVYYTDMSSEPSRSIQFYVGPSLKAVDTDKHVINSSKDLKFVCSGTIDPKNVRVGTGNGWLEEGNQFTLSGNGRYITLKAKFLNARTAGETYTLYVKTTENNNEWVSCNFRILTTAQASSSPRTGDDSNIGLWLVFMAVSGGAVAVALPKLKKGKD